MPTAIRNAMDLGMCLANPDRAEREVLREQCWRPFPLSSSGIRTIQRQKLPKETWRWPQLPMEMGPTMLQKKENRSHLTIVARSRQSPGVMVQGLRMPTAILLKRFLEQTHCPITNHNKNNSLRSLPTTSVRYARMTSSRARI